jgi:hypothetical protein
MIDIHAISRENGETEVLLGARSAMGMLLNACMAVWLCGIRRGAQLA